MKTTQNLTSHQQSLNIYDTLGRVSCAHVPGAEGVRVRRLEVPGDWRMKEFAPR